MAPSMRFHLVLEPDSRQVLVVCQVLYPPTNPLSLGHLTKGPNYRIVYHLNGFLALPHLRGS